MTPTVLTFNLTALSRMEIDQHDALLLMAGLLLLLLVVAARLRSLRALLVASDTGGASVFSVLFKKLMLLLYGYFFLVFSSDKVSKKQIKKTHQASQAGGGVEREVRLVFVRHGESVWNYVFNRGFGPSFLVRLVRVTLHELYLLPFDDSAYFDSPLSALGLEQCAGLQKFLRTPCLDAKAEADFRALTSGEAHSVIVSSQLRRAAATVAIALSDRLSRSKEKVHLVSACQEISRNIDTMGIAPAGTAPSLWLPDPSMSASTSFDASSHLGNKSLSTPGHQRLLDFAAWAADRPEETIIVGGHSLWFRSFFQLFLPPDLEHPSKKKKIVNCGVVGLTLQVLRDYDGVVRYRIDPASIAVVYGGFATK